MNDKLNQFIDRLSEYLAYRKGLLPSLGLILILVNWILQLIPGLGWLASSNTLLHLGVIVAILGIMVGWAL